MIFVELVFFFSIVLVCGENDESPKHMESYVDFVVDDVRSLEKMNNIFARLKK